MNNETFVDPTYDFGFKLCFGDTEILTTFIRHILPRVNISRVDEVTLVEGPASAPVSPTTVENEEEDRTQQPRSRSAERSLRSLNSEDVGVSIGDRVIRFDVVCVSDQEEYFIVEMQKGPSQFFLHRMEYYKSRLIVTHQGYGGKKKKVNSYTGKASGEPTF